MTSAARAHAPPRRHQPAIRLATHASRRCCSSRIADHRAEVQRADRRDEAPEDRQVGLAHVAQEAEHRARPARVGQPPAEREEQRAEDVGDDQQRVDVRRPRARSRRVLRGRWRARAVMRLRIASSASENAARTPAALQRVEPAGGRAARRGDRAARGQRVVALAAQQLGGARHRLRRPGARPGRRSARGARRRRPAPRPRARSRPGRWTSGPWRRRPSRRRARRACRAPRAAPRTAASSSASCSSSAARMTAPWRTSTGVEGRMR